VAAGADGSVYIADTWNNRIRKVGPDGVITTVAGDGWRDEKRNIKGRFQGDGGPAAEASLCHPHGVALGPDGSLYIADSDNNRIRKVDANGIMTTVAGIGMEGCSGDGGLAKWARLNWPRAVAVGADGSLYIADTCNHRVRKVDPNGVITTVAGNGEEGYWGDGGPALEASLYFPRGVAVGADGSLCIADYGNNRVRKVATDGIITTVAGNGSIGGSGDGGRATEANLYHPRGVAMGSDGSIYIADTWNHRIRRVDPNGIISTAAGSGREGYSGDGRRATSASMRDPEDVAVAPDGSLYIADRLNHRVRKVCAGEPVAMPPAITILEF
jgi:sugar lactone lactonase YvrE